MVLTSFIGFPSAFGLAAVSGSFVALYYGADFAVCGDIVFALCPIVIIISLGDVVRSQYLYPLSKDAYMVAILCINAIINLVLTITLIPYIGVYGAVIGTTAAETMGLILEFLICRKYHPVKNFIENGLPLAVLGLVMYGVVKVVASYVGGGIQALMIQVAVGAAVYLLLTLIYAKFFNRILFEAYKSVLDIVVKFIKKL